MRILVIAGPTVVPVDSVRVLTNVSSGQLGAELVKALERLGAEVEVWVARTVAWRYEKVDASFYTYWDLSRLIEDCKGGYDWVVQASAVSDFRPEVVETKKLSSGKEVSLKLIPLPKLWPRLLSKAKGLVLFKLQDDLDEAVGSAIRLLGESDPKVRMVVANTLSEGYQGCIVERSGKVSEVFKDRAGLAEVLAQALVEERNG